jgi:hypothetical protein
MAMRDPNAADGPPRLRLNPILCDGVDDWGYPIVERRPLEDGRLQRLARRAVAQCPRVALALTAAEDTRGS